MSLSTTACGWQDSWPAPAKLNLFLHVVGRRADGLHLLQTVFRFVDYADTLRFCPRDDGRIVLATPLPGVPPADDLTVRAAKMLQAAAGITQGVDIHLDKRLPMGGGLGGGSSDAATTLLALNQLWGSGLPRAALQALGLRLGADVPVFIHGHATFAEGVGERFSDVMLPPAWYLVLIPPVAVPTAQIFNAPDLRRDTPVMRAHEWQPGAGHNDLEPVACCLYPEVAAHLAWLRQHAAHAPARMSGSGACVFAEFTGDQAEAEARRVHATLPENMRGFVACGLDRNPALPTPTSIISG
ncbi:MAG: 4-(cytidine 5'-diphospho)-2-C-methyl-D-erythritol kinase [Sterolibacterium sp.]|nr:4-(cytidine 5'-diphospho)-2-C-methyl-D-erythritol kinase [Sterolibacterium sp.]